MIRGKSIIVGLALLLMSSNACAQEAVNRLQKSYQSSKQQFKQNQTADLFNTLNGQLDNIEAAIASSGMSSRWRSDKNNWVQQERAWLRGMMPAPARQMSFDAQQKQLNQLIADFTTASPDIGAMRGVYANAQAILPQLNLIDDGDKQDLLKTMQDMIQEQGERNRYPVPATPPERVKSQFDAAEKAFNDKYATWQASPTVFKILEMDVLLFSAKKLADDQYNQLIDQKRMDALSKKFDQAMTQELLNIKKAFDRNYAGSNYKEASKNYKTFTTVYQGVYIRSAAVPSIQLAKASDDITKKYTDIRYREAQGVIDELFDYLASRRNDISARKAESILIRILNNANRDIESEQQQALIEIILKAEEQAETKTGKEKDQVISYGFIQAYEALKGMTIAQDAPRSIDAPITSADKKVKYIEPEAKEQKNKRSAR